VSRLETAAVACLVLGAGLLFPFEETVTILLGVLLLLAWIVLGVFALATPDRLEGEPGGQAPSESDR
jgi:hypothetical protein